MNAKLSIRLWGIINKDSCESINYQIAEKLITNIFQIQDTSTRGIADICNVSKGSISKFCKELGYSNYFDFRQDLHQYRVTVDKTSAYQKCRPMGMKSIYLERCKHYIDELDKNLSEIVLQELVQIIAKSPKVFLMGHLQSGSIAANLQYNLFMCKKSTHVYTEINQQKTVFRSLKGRECIIVFSVSGSFFRDYFEEDILNNVPDDTNVFFITAVPGQPELPGVTQINCGTSADVAASNLSLELIANMIYMKYENYVR